KWQARDNGIVRNIIQRTAATLTTRTANADVYEGLDRGQPLRFERPRFRFQFFSAMFGGVILSLPVTCLGLLVRWVVGRYAIKPGHCWKCGYNLTGAPHKRCPECGEAMADGTL